MTAPRATEILPVNSTHGPATPKLTHALQYQRANGKWDNGHFGYTLSEARSVAKIGRARTGRAVRAVKLP